MNKVIGYDMMVIKENKKVLRFGVCEKGHALELILRYAERGLSVGWKPVMKRVA